VAYEEHPRAKPEEVFYYVSAPSAGHVAVSTVVAPPSRQAAVGLLIMQGCRLNPTDTECQISMLREEPRPRIFPRSSPCKIIWVETSIPIPLRKIYNSAGSEIAYGAIFDHVLELGGVEELSARASDDDVVLGINPPFGLAPLYVEVSGNDLPAQLEIGSVWRIIIAHSAFCRIDPRYENRHALNLDDGESTDLNPESTRDTYPTNRDRYRHRLRDEDFQSSIASQIVHHHLDGELRFVDKTTPTPLDLYPLNRGDR